MSQPRKVPTRTRLMDAAQDLILDYGYSGTSLDRLIERAGVTKGTFFYHFKSKAELAHALVQRFADQDGELLEEYLAKAEAAHDDPLDQVLYFIGLFEEMMGQLTEPYPGCLFASYVMEKGLFDDETLGIARSALNEWRVAFGRKLGRRTPPSAIPGGPGIAGGRPQRGIRGRIHPLQHLQAARNRRRAAGPLPAVHRAVVRAGIKVGTRGSGLGTRVGSRKGAKRGEDR